MGKIVILGVVIVLLGGAIFGLSQKAKKAEQQTCTTIQNGVLTYSAGHYLAGQPLQAGYDQYGYNYQAHMFNGLYANSYLGKDGLPPYDGDTDAYLAENPSAESKWYWPYRDVELMMKWDENWLGNKDCSGDGALDRHYGTPSYQGSSAWLTNHQKGTYEENGKTQRWEYFVKIVAAPSDANKIGNTWFMSNGTEIGPAIWGEFATIQSVYNDTGTGEHGIEYLSPAGPGFGKF